MLNQPVWEAYCRFFPIGAPPFPKMGAFVEHEGELLAGCCFWPTEGPYVVADFLRVKEDLSDELAGKAIKLVLNSLRGYLYLSCKSAHIIGAGIDAKHFVSLGFEQLADNIFAYVPRGVSLNAEGPQPATTAEEPLTGRESNAITNRPEDKVAAEPKKRKRSRSLRPSRQKESDA